MIIHMVLACFSSMIINQPGISSYSHQPTVFFGSRSCWSKWPSTGIHWEKKTTTWHVPYGKSATCESYTNYKKNTYTIKRIIILINDPHYGPLNMILCPTIFLSMILYQIKARIMEIQKKPLANQLLIILILQVIWGVPFRHGGTTIFIIHL